VAVGAFSLLILAAGATGILVGNADPNVPADVVVAADRSGRASRDLVRTPVTVLPTPTTSPSTTALPPGAETSRITAGDRAASAAKPKATSTASRGSVPVPTSCRRYSGNQRTACALLPKFGFPIGEMSALVPLWNHESGWNHRAENPSSGAYGIPQALPGSKMGSVASDWRTNPATQIRWGLGYIKGRYGSPSGAWSFWQANGWY
jgi:hypothetical protein